MHCFPVFEQDNAQVPSACLINPLPPADAAIRLNTLSIWILCNEFNPLQFYGAPVLPKAHMLEVLSKLHVVNVLCRKRKVQT
jgi:hypothetical protein